MNKYVKEFLHRGLLFGGFGPIIMAIVYFIHSCVVKGFTLSGPEVFWATCSIYLLAFVHAGSSVFNQIEHWPVTKSLLCQLGTLYVAYVICYLVNNWIPFNPMVILIFTIIFVIGYLVIWGIVYSCVKICARKLSEKLV